MSAEESLPMGEMTPEQRQRAAEAQEVADIRERHQTDDGECGGIDFGGGCTKPQAYADRARLLDLLEAALLREARLAGELREAREAIAAALDSLLRVPEMHGGIEAQAVQVLLLLRLLHGPGVMQRWHAYEHEVAPDKPGAMPLWDWLQGERSDVPAQVRVTAALRAFAERLRPAGTLASLPADECDGSDR